MSIFEPIFRDVAYWNTITKICGQPHRLLALGSLAELGQPRNAAGYFRSSIFSRRLSTTLNTRSRDTTEVVFKSLLSRPAVKLANMSNLSDQCEPSGGSPRQPLTSPESPTSKTSAETPAEPDLPPLTDHEFKTYNRMAVKMDYFVRPP